MTTDTDLLEQIVSGVMQQLASMSGEVRSNGSEETKQTGSGNATNERLLTENVITAELLSQRLSGLGNGSSGWLGSNEVSPQTSGRPGAALCGSLSPVRLSIGPRSVLTPSARDWLREHNIAWRRRTENGTEITTNNGNWKVIVEHSTPAVIAAVDDRATAKGDRWATERADDFRAAVDAAVSAVCRAEADGIVLITDKPAVAACLANRNRKVRAAATMGVTCVRAARRQMGANLLCVDPTGRTVWELKTILRELNQSGRPIPPDGWQKCGLK